MTPPAASSSSCGRAVAEASYTFRINVAQLGAEVGPILARKAASITRRIVAQARQNAPVRTGNLARSIEADPIRFVGPFRIDTGVTAHANYAAAVHEGTRPHVIRPRVARALRFEMDGRVVFAKSVQHPGTRARPFLRNAADEVARNP